MTSTKLRLLSVPLGTRVRVSVRAVREPFHDVTIDVREGGLATGEFIADVALGLEERNRWVATSEALKLANDLLLAAARRAKEQGRVGDLLDEDFLWAVEEVRAGEKLDAMEGRR